MKNDFNKDDMISDEGDSDKLKKYSQYQRSDDHLSKKNINNDRYFRIKETTPHYVDSRGKRDYYGEYYDTDQKGNDIDEKTKSRSINDHSFYELGDYYGLNPYANSSYNQHYGPKSVYTDDMRPIYMRSNDHGNKYSYDDHYYHERQHYEPSNGLPISYNLNRAETENKRRAKIRICSNCSTTSTPSWRRSTDHRLLLCNACGLYKKLHGRDRPFNITSDGRTKAVKVNVDKLRCRNCHTTETSSWRKGPDGLPLCNHCGLYFSNAMIGTDSNSDEYKRHESEPNPKIRDNDPPSHYYTEETYKNTPYNRYNNSFQSGSNRRTYSSIANIKEANNDQYYMSRYSHEKDYLKDDDKRFEEIHKGEIIPQESNRLAKTTQKKADYVDEEERFYKNERKDFEK